MRKKAVQQVIAGVMAGMFGVAMAASPVVANAENVSASKHTQKPVSKTDPNPPRTTSTISNGYTVQTNVMVTMRDGTKLATDIYLPTTGGPKFPTLVTRTPYGKDSSAKEAELLAEHGYAVVVQDCRGLGKSQGVYYPFKDDGADGYDTIEWAAAQPWSTGAVGTYGASALGIDQEAAALLNPPHLKAMFVEVATNDFFTEASYQGGAYRQELDQGWMNAMNVEQLSQGHLRGLTPAQAQQALATIYPIYQNYYNFAIKNPLLALNQFSYLNAQLMPGYLDSLDPIDGPSNPDYQNMESLNVSDKYSQIHVPVYHVGGFQDIFEAGVLGTYQGLQTEGGVGARGNQKLLMGPWTHLTLGQGGGTTPWAANAAVNLDTIMVQWFDYWLKGVHNHIMQTPNVQYYVTGSNTWQTSQSWPLPQERSTPFYLEGGRSGSIQSLNDGTLSEAAPSVTWGADSYQYDPSHPTLTVGGNNLEISAGPADQSAVEKGVLTYTSSPLSNPLTVVGPLSATLYASSSAVDTDFTVKLTDVSPDGKSTLIEDGIVRAQYRDGQQKSELLTPGQVYKFTVNLIAASHTFPKGDRIRVDIASSNYPRFNINTNTGIPQNLNPSGAYVIADNTIYHDAEYPSAINLPVVPGDGAGAYTDLSLGGKHGYKVKVREHQSATFLPIWYLLQELRELGYQTTWNGRVWRIAAPGQSLGNDADANVPTNFAGIMVNGHVVYTDLGKLMDGGTTYLDGYSVASVLRELGVPMSGDLDSLAGNSH